MSADRTPARPLSQSSPARLARLVSEGDQWARWQTLQLLPVADLHLVDVASRHGRLSDQQQLADAITRARTVLPRPRDGHVEDHPQLQERAEEQAREHAGQGPTGQPGDDEQPARRHVEVDDDGPSSGASLRDGAVSTLHELLFARMCQAHLDRTARTGRVVRAYPPAAVERLRAGLTAALGSAADTGPNLVDAYL